MKKLAQTGITFRNFINVFFRLLFGVIMGNNLGCCSCFICFSENKRLTIISIIVEYN